MTAVENALLPHIEESQFVFRVQQIAHFGRTEFWRDGA
jgi:hypothetical protein